jgi:hypothetical protein
MFVGGVGEGGVTVNALWAIVVSFAGVVASAPGVR